MLYINTVLFHVYRLCRKGQPLCPVQARAAGPVLGDLWLSTRAIHARYTALAQLFKPGSEDAYALPVLMDAEIRRITAVSMLINGTEVIPRAQSSKAQCDYYLQRWLCKQVSLWKISCYPGT
jgi:hypothetical protein